MTSTLRSFAFGLASMLAVGAMAQYPYTWVIEGQVAGCYPGQTINIQTIQGTQPTINIDVPLDANCEYQTVLSLSSSISWVQLNTLCNGVIMSATDSAYFNFVLDTAWSTINFTCNGGGPDTDGDGIPDANDNCPNTPGVIGSACDDGDPFTNNDVLNASCICVGDTNGMAIDCLGEPGGSALPGTACVTFLNEPGIWSQGCSCIANGQATDCMGVLNGPDMPGTACDDGLVYTTNDTWNANCVCIGDSGNVFQYDCMGVLNGPDMPGTACEAFGIVGIWSANCACVEDNPAPCEANYWVLQAYVADSNNIEPIPYELWIWNLSSGGSGVYSYLWDFGDGSSSTEAFPTHTYDDNGPYTLCLTIDDGNGCIDTYCDSVSIDDNGFYTGIAGEENRSDGFTINVQNQLTGVQDVVSMNDLATWPNPVVDELNIALVSDLRGVVNVIVTDLNGRVVLNEQRTLTGGKSQLRIATNDLGAGLYTVRIGNNDTSISQRFVKTR